jgi:hypothetical protein
VARGRRNGKSRKRKQNEESKKNYNQGKINKTDLGKVDGNEE